MAAATEWLNALAAGARVTSIRRREPPAATAQRTAAALLPARASPPSTRRAPERRAALLPGWARPRTHRDAPGTNRSRGPPGRAVPRRARAQRRRQIICATGFKRGFRHGPLLARLVDDNELDPRPLDRARAGLHRAGAHRPDATLAIAGVAAQWAYPGRRHARGREVRGPRLPQEGAGVSYTLRGRHRLPARAGARAALVAAVLALALHRWWPRRARRTDGRRRGRARPARLRPRARLPAGLAGASARCARARPRVLAVARARRPGAARLALALFAFAWLRAQLCSHARCRACRCRTPKPAESSDGRASTPSPSPWRRPLAAVSACATRRLRSTSPPASTGPVADRPRGDARGEPGAVVRGGIVVRAEPVKLRHVTIVGGENGIDVNDAQRVLLDNVRVIGREDRRHPRPHLVSDDPHCTVDRHGERVRAGNRHLVLVGRGMSSVESCTSPAAARGSPRTPSMVMIDNQVIGTSLRGIAMSEMSMGDGE